MLRTVPCLSLLVAPVCYEYAVKPMPLEAIEFPVDTLEIWVLKIDVNQGYLEPNDSHLYASAGNVARSVVRMKKTVGLIPNPGALNSCGSLSVD